MKIVMLEPLGVREELVMEQFRPIVETGNEFVYCGQPLTQEQKLARAAGADIFIIANGKLDPEVVEAAPDLKMISVGFTGIDHVPVDLCKKKGIMICNAQGYATNATAELAIGLMLSCLRKLPQCDDAVRHGGVVKGMKHNTLNGKTLGIIGTGAIGTHVAELAKAFGCKVLGYSRSQRDSAKAAGVEYTDLDSLLAQSDIVSLHCPLTDETKGLINADKIALMKESAILINCSRGPVVDSSALAAALDAGKIAGAGIDVYETEPPIDGAHPLLGCANAVLTPHAGFYSEESLYERLIIVADNVRAYLAGKPINVK